MDEISHRLRTPDLNEVQRTATERDRTAHAHKSLFCLFTTIHV